MSIALKDIAASVGLEIADDKDFTLDAFKAHVDKSYINRDAVLKDEDIKEKIVGTVFGKVNTRTAQIFGLKHDEVKGKKIEDVLEAVKSSYDTKIEELTAAAGKGNDQKVEELTKKIGALETKNQEITSLRDQLATKLTETETNFTGKLKEFKLTDKLGKVKSELSNLFTDEFKADKLKQSGFESHVSSLYEFDLDENDNPIVIDKATKKHVQSKSKVGFPATPDEVLKEQAEALGIIKKNNANGQVKPVIRTKVVDGGSDPMATVHPALQKRMAKA